MKHTRTYEDIEFLLILRYQAFFELDPRTLVFVQQLVDDVRNQLPLRLRARGECIISC